MSRSWNSDTTCWDLIKAAAAGDLAQRERFVKWYQTPIRAYLIARWRGSRYMDLIDDAVQEVFAECFRSEGPLQRIDPAQGGFRAYLYGIVRNVARQCERKLINTREQNVEGEMMLAELAQDEVVLSGIFDRAWAFSVMKQAADLQRQQAQVTGVEALKRVELLQLRFHEEMPIRDIASRWGMDPAKVHREYAKARAEFRSALFEVIANQQPGTAKEIHQRATELIAMLG